MKKNEAINDDVKPYITYYDQMPIPAKEESTEFFETETVAIGVEFRVLTDEAIAICLRYRFRNKLFDIKRDKFRHYFEQACKRASIYNFRFHDLRACAITNLFLKGWSVAEVSVVSGHKTWAELKRYTRIKPIQLVEKINLS